MKLTLREALQITPLKNATFLAGEAEQDREIQNVNIVEVPDTVRWMRGGEIMFSSGFAFSGDANKGCALLDSLNTHHISALVLKPGPYMPEVPKAMIGYAEKIGFPLLQVPRDMPFNIYIESIYALLLDKQTLIQNIGSSEVQFWESEFITSEKRNNICNILMERIKTSVLYLSLRGSVEAVFQYGQDVLDIAALKHEKRSILEWETTHHLVLISEEMEPHAYFAVERRADFPSETDAAMMEYAAMMISVELRKERAFLEQKERHRSELLHDLILKNFGDPIVLKRRCELLQFDMKESFVAFAVSAQPNDRHAAEPGNPCVIHSYIRNILERRVLQFSGSLLMLEEEDLLLGVVSFTKHQDGPILVHDMMQDMLLNVNHAYQNMCTTAGLSVECAGVGQISHAVQEAKEAVRINQRLSNKKQLVSLKELGVFRVLCELKATDAMKEFYDLTLHKILVSDNGEDLIKTLECYFDNECNLRKTSEALFLHKNSVKYRLSRIEQLLGERITDAETELNLRICLKYRQIL